MTWCLVKEIEVILFDKWAITYFKYPYPGAVFVIASCPCFECMQVFNISLN
jgi:hypothetical protein|nr:MAG TPA: hypothetical protein [Caudoviricetes sp.]